MSSRESIWFCWCGTACVTGSLIVGCSSDSTATETGRDSGRDATVTTPRGTGGMGPTAKPDAGHPHGGNVDAAIRDAAAPDVSERPDASAPADAAADGRSDASATLAYAWQVSYDQSYAAHVEADSKGSAIVSGTFFDTKDITLGTTVLHSHGAADIMLSRVLPGGDVDWARGYGAAADDYPVSFVLDPADGIHLVGLYNGTGNVGGPSFPAFAGTPTRFDAYVAALTANGDHRWSKAITSTEEAFAGPGLSLDGAGNLIVPGSFLGTTTIGATAHASQGSWDAFFARYVEPTGDVAAQLPFGGAGDDRASQALFTGSDVLVLGRFTGTVTFPTVPPKSLTSAGGTDVFIARVTLSGTMTSVVSFGGTGDEDVTRAVLTSDGKVVLGGVFSSTALSVLGGRALGSAGGKDFFVAALTPALTQLWSVSYGGDADDYLRDLAVDGAGNVAITGEFRNSLTLGDRTWVASRAADASPSDIDFFVATLDAAGAPSWSHAAGGPGADRGLGIAVDRGGDLYVTASFQSPIDFGGGKTLTPAPGQFASALVRYAKR